MEIKLKEVQALCDKLLTYMQNEGIEAVDIPVDYYWHIPKDQRYDPYHDPAKLDLGQLSDDWNELVKISSGEENHLTAYHLVWLSTIIRAIGEIVIV